MSRGSLKTLEVWQKCMLDNTSHILILMAAGLLGLAVNLAGNASQSIESKEVVVLVVEEQPDEVMV